MRSPIALAALVGTALLSRQASARDYGVEMQIEEVSDLYELYDQEEISAEEMELLVALFNRPININRVDRLGLYDLPEITYDIADAIIAYRAANGAFERLDDLLNVEGVDATVLAAIAPFVAMADDEEQAEEKAYAGKATLGVLGEAELGKDLRTEARQVPRKPPSGFLTATVNAFTYYSAGLQMTMRPLVQPQWNLSRGGMVADGRECDNKRYACPWPLFNVDAAYATFARGEMSGIVGSYNVGFGERLVFDTTGQANPRGWDDRLALTMDRDDASLRPRANLRGAAIALDGADFPVGWMDATAFISYQSHDAYYTDIWYQPDDHFGAATCQTDGDCPDGFTCRADNLCYSSTVWDSEAPAKKFRYHTLQDAFTELLFGANASFYSDEQTQFGATAYYSQVAFNITEQVAPRFSWSARYPNRPAFGAAGANAALSLGPVDLAAEAGATFLGKPAAVVRAVVDPGSWGEVVLSWRYYDRDYDNPHSRSTAAAVETFGSRRRNEHGGRLELHLRPHKQVRLITRVDLFRRPFEESFTSGDVDWKLRPASYLRAQQRLIIQASRKERIGLQADYNNNVLEHNSRQEFYASDRDENTYSRVIGRGEKRQLRVTFATTRIPRLRLTSAYVFALVDTTASGVDFGRQQYLRFAFSAEPWVGGRFTGAVKYWPEQVQDNSDDDLAGYLGLAHRFAGGALSMQVVYGVTGRKRVPGSYTDEKELDVAQFGMLQVGSRF